MTNEQDYPSKAEMLAELVIGNTDLMDTGATVQRSHRFPLHIFVQIENMANMAKVPVSVIVNQLLDCGLDAVSKELPKDIVKQLIAVSKDQMERSTKSMKIEVKNKSSVVSKPKVKK
ncbi:MAG: hypothetical protein DID92_2727744051 [Candidatus Nitrotoga sp. SPKER]|nr:MAG: hypothetical protein DID92_2727744051 [Candidatus Nitrotoga sp. SPKER]